MDAGRHARELKTRTPLYPPEGTCLVCGRYFAPNEKRARALGEYAVCVGCATPAEREDAR
jgi:hypothetical protein